MTWLCIMQICVARPDILHAFLLLYVNYSSRSFIFDPAQHSVTNDS